MALVAAVAGAVLAAAAVAASGAAAAVAVTSAATAAAAAGAAAEAAAAVAAVSAVAATAAAAAAVAVAGAAARRGCIERGPFRNRVPRPSLPPKFWCASTLAVTKRQYVDVLVAMAASTKKTGVLVGTYYKYSIP